MTDSQNNIPTSCILVADCGSTNCDWCAVAPGGSRHEFHTPGFNAAVSNQGEVRESLEAAGRLLADEGLTPRQVYFYGAGCGSEAVCRRMTEALRDAFGCPEVHAESDLLGAARALFGNRPGVACILGTGSNSGYYDGREITFRVPPLGFILGDEGSGADLGRRLLRAVCRRTLPEEVIGLFNSKYNLTEADIIEATYRRPGANAFMASFAPFLSENIEIPEVGALVDEAFGDFRRNSLDVYLRHHPEASEIGIVGSVASHFAPRLRAILVPLTLNTLSRPLAALAAFHS